MMMENIERTAGLSKSNSLAIIVFRASCEENSSFYGINAFKVLEIQSASKFEFVKPPINNPLFEGSVVLRNETISVINLPGWLGVEMPPEDFERSLIIFCNFNHRLVGLHVAEVTQLITREWDKVRPFVPPEGLLENKNMNYTFLPDNETICLILDVEQLLAEIMPEMVQSATREVETVSEEDLFIPQALRDKTVLIAEDSKVAQMFLKKAFGSFNVNYRIFDNGKLLLEYITALDNPNMDVPIVVTDLEMPEISGHTVVRELKGDPRTREIPIIVNSSMTNESSVREVQELGADGFIGKPEMRVLVEEVVKLYNARQL
jgi:two-component system chemotaxis response regulator CheV